MPDGCLPDNNICNKATPDKTDFLKICYKDGDLSLILDNCQNGFICKNGVCVPDTCGKSGDGNCETSPEGYKICPDKDNPNDYDPVICKKNAECGYSYLKGVNYCIENSNSCPEPSNKLCIGTITNICCPGGLGCETSYGVPFCVNEGKCGVDSNYQETACFNEDGKEKGKFCCKNTETCSIKSGIKICQPKDGNSCNSADGETFCQGVISSKYELRKRCCEKGTECINKYQNKPIYPACVKI
ncbi:MAG: hypothetical protein AABX03_00845 [Nanoarchaeota archaeon]